MAKTKTLNDLFLHQLRDLAYAEKHGGKAVGKLAKAATDEAVKHVLEEAAGAAHTALDGLEGLFETLDKKAHGVPCAAMQGLVEEAKDLLDEFEDSGALDTGLLADAHAMLTYTASRAATLRTWAGRLGLADASPVLDRILAEKRRLVAEVEHLADTAAAAAPSQGSAEPALTLKTAALTGLR